MKTISENLSVLHADHGISEAQMDYIARTTMTIMDLDPNLSGFFIRQVAIPPELGEVPCGLYGPAMGDDPVGDDEVTYESRGDRPWKDRLINKPMRPVQYVQVIGIEDHGKYTVFTVYGGPLAPQNPSDPSNEDVESSKQFWAEHALVA